MGRALKKFLETGNESFLISYLRGFENGEIDIEIEELIRVLKEGSHKVKYWAVRSSFKRLPLPEFKSLMEKVFNVKAKSLPVEFEFPVVGSNGGSLAKGIGILVDKKQGGKLAPVEDLLNSGVLAFFDREFGGESFQASLAYALLYGELPSELLISGKLYGEEFSADFREEKEKIARDENKILIAEGNLKEIGEVLKRKDMNIPFFITTDEFEVAKRSFQLLSETVDFRPIRGFLDEKELIFKLPQFLPHTERWDTFLNALRERLLIIDSKVRGRFSLHIAFRSPAAFSFGAGVIVGTGKIPLIVYHYENRMYHKVIDLTEDSRKIKVRRKELQHVEIIPKVEGESDSSVVALQLASHETEDKGLELSQKLKSDYFYVQVRETELHQKGKLSLNADWASIVADLYEALNRIYNRGYKKFHLIMSVPNPIAFALGMAVGNYWDIEVWSYFKDIKDYKAIFNVDKIQSI